MSHTPGPWRTLDESEDNAIWVESPTWMVAKVLVDVAELQEEGPANARLIAAAPELLDALKELVDILDGVRVHDQIDSFTTQPARVAIAKATGGAK